MNMKTNVKSIYRNVGELIHEWCNNKLRATTPYYIGDYSCTKDDFWVGSLHVATRVNGHMFFTHFDRVGRFGNGYSIYNFFSATPHGTKYYMVDKLPDKDTFKNATNFKHWYGHEFINKNTTQFKALSYIKEFINNNRRRTQWIKLDNINITIDFIPPIYLKKFAATILNISIKDEYQHVHYSRWGSYGERFPAIVINNTIKQVLDKSYLKDIFTDEELEWYEFKLWHLEYGVNLTIHESREVYLDPDARKNRTEKIEHHRKMAEEKRLAKEKEKNKESYIKFINSLEEWKNKQSSYPPTGAFLSWQQPYQAIKLLRNEGVTSLRVHVPMEELKKAYKLFKLYKDKDKVYDYTNIAGDTTLVHDYNVLYIKPLNTTILKDDELTNEEVWCIVIGCHKVPEFEIDDFVKRNNLNW